MGVNTDVKEFFQKVESNLETTLDQLGSSSSVANCNVTIGSFFFESSKNCSIVIENKCVANAQTALDGVVKAMSDAFNSMSSLQQASIAAMTANVNTGIQTTSQDFVQKMSSHINQTCQASAVNNSQLTLGTVAFGPCESTGESATIKFINTGQATANCGMKIINDLQLTSVNEANNQQSSNFAGISQIFDSLGNIFKSFSRNIFIAIGAIIFIPIIIIIISKAIKKAKKEKEINIEDGNLIPTQYETSKLTPGEIDLAKETLKKEPFHWSLYSKFVE